MNRLYVMNDEKEFGISFDLICPECGVGNPGGSENCLVCDKNLEETIAFLEDDSFDLEITSDCLLEYRKNFWGTERTGKINKYLWSKMDAIEFGSPINRFIFFYDNKRIVIPLREENMKILKEFLRNHL